MGICHCKCKERNARQSEHDGASRPSSNAGGLQNSEGVRSDGLVIQDWWKTVSPKDVETLILDSLKIIRSLVEK